jgi:Flp pilus assembly protein TadG
MTREAKRGVRSNERGVVIVWTAFFMIVMLGFVAIGIDIAKLMATRTQLQNAADAAALAGASAINEVTGALDPDTALARAQETAGRNMAFVNGPEPLQLSAADVQFSSPRRISVTVRRGPSSGGSMVTHMAQTLGITSLTLSATATAMAERSGSVDCGVIPIAVNPSSGAFSPGCSGYSLRPPSASGARYSAVTLPVCDNGPCAGMSSTSSTTYQCLVDKGYCCTIDEGQTLNTRSSYNGFTTRQAINNRFDSDTDRREDICYSQYRGNGRRVVVVPITTRPRWSRPTVTVTEFGAFFIKRRMSSSSSSLRGEFLYAVAPGGPGGASGGTLYSVRLVR